MALDAHNELYPAYPETAGLEEDDSSFSRRLRDLHLLHRISKRVSSTLNLQEILDAVTQEVCDTLGYPGSSILLPDKEGESLLVQASWGLSPDYGNELNRRRGVSLRSPEGHEWPGEYAFRYGLPYSATDVMSLTFLRPIRDLLVQQNVRSLLCVPLIHLGTSIGVLTAYSEHSRPHEKCEIDLLMSVAGQVAAAVQNARLYQNGQTAAIEQERKRLAREIHDVLAQSLIGLVFQLDTVDLLIATNPDAARRELQESRTMARDLLGQARRSIWALQPTPLLDRSLDEAIADDLDRLADDASIATRWSVVGSPPRLAPDVETAAYRIAQECLSNIRKHSQARRVRAAITFGAEQLELTITDNGVGFDFTELPGPSEVGGFGLISMSERATMLGGSLEVQSARRRGATVTLRLPYVAPQALRAGWQDPDSPSARNAVRILLVDDHPLARQGIRRMMDGQAEILVIGEAADGEEAVRLYEQLRPDVVLMDLQMPRLSGIDALRAIREIDNEARVIIVTAYSQDERLFEALKEGARGFLLKDTIAEDLASAVMTVSRGESLVQPNMTLKLVDRFGRMARHEMVHEELTDRERDVLRLIFAGMRNKEIAGALTISEQTIKFHVGNLFHKLDVSSRTEAVNVALERGWLSV